MKEEILNNLDNPQRLEKLYREHKPGFKKEFNSIYDHIKDQKIARFWNERLNYEPGEISWGTGNDLLGVITICVFAALFAKLPALFGWNQEFFYQRNIGFIVLPFLTIYFAQQNSIPIRKLYVPVFAIILSLIYINVLPSNNESDTLILACIHLPLFLWAILGITYTGEGINDYNKRIEFLKYNGDLLVMSALIVIAGGILTGITIGLFSMIDLHIEVFYFEYVVICGLSACPIVATYLIRTNPQLVGKVTPVIAKIFSPLVLVMLVIYLIAIVVSGKDPYNDREFLMLFNLLLIGVMALILFSVAENSRGANNKQTTVILFLLSVVTIVVNGIALSAILFRISEWGITPNRISVLGANILILTNLLLVAVSLFKALKQPDRIDSVEKVIANFLPVYSLWTMVVAFIFPVAFGFK